MLLGVSRAKGLCKCCRLTSFLAQLLPWRSREAASVGAVYLLAACLFLLTTEGYVLHLWEVLNLLSYSPSPGTTLILLWVKNQHVHINIQPHLQRQIVTRHWRQVSTTELWKFVVKKTPTLFFLFLLLLVFQLKSPVFSRLTKFFKFLSWSWLPSGKKDSHLRFTCLKFQVLTQLSTYIWKEKLPLKPPPLHANPNENWADFCDWAGLWAFSNIPVLLLHK